MLTMAMDFQLEVPFPARDEQRALATDGFHALGHGRRDRQTVCRDDLQAVHMPFQLE